MHSVNDPESFFDSNSGFVDRTIHESIDWGDLFKIALDNQRIEINIAPIMQMIASICGQDQELVKYILGIARSVMQEGYNLYRLYFFHLKDELERKERFSRLFSFNDNVNYYITIRAAEEAQKLMARYMTDRLMAVTMIKNLSVQARVELQDALVKTLDQVNNILS